MDLDDLIGNRAITSLQYLKRLLLNHTGYAIVGRIKDYLIGPNYIIVPKLLNWPEIT